MNPFDWTPIAAVLEAASGVLSTLVSALDPVADSASAALAIVLVTLAVRAALIPLGRSQMRAELARRRLAPRIRELQKRYRSRPQVLQTKTLELYREEGTHPLAGVWTVLVQLPIVSVLYAVLTRPTIAGHANALLGAHLGGIPLGTSLLGALGSGPAAPAILTAAILLGALVATATVARRQSIRLANLDGSATGLTRALASLSYLGVAFALIAPLGAALYITVTTAWTLVERSVLRRMLVPR